MKHRIEPMWNIKVKYKLNLKVKCKLNLYINLRRCKYSIMNHTHPSKPLNFQKLFLASYKINSLLNIFMSKFILKFTEKQVLKFAKKLRMSPFT
jgi:hypothetical protein